MTHGMGTMTVPAAASFYSWLDVKQATYQAEARVALKPRGAMADIHGHPNTSPMEPRA